MFPDESRPTAGSGHPLRRKVFQYGDALAIVCADTIEQARAAVANGEGRLEELRPT